MVIPSQMWNCWILSPLSIFGLSLRDNIIRWVWCSSVRLGPFQIVLPVWIRLSNGAGGRITPKSDIFLKFLSGTTRPNVLKIIWELCLVRPLASGKRGSGAFLYFCVRHQNVFSRPIRPIRIWYEALGQWGVIILCSTSESASRKGLGDNQPRSINNKINPKINNKPKSGIFWKSFGQKLRGRLHWNYYGDSCSMSICQVVLGIAIVSRYWGRRGRPLFWHRTQKGLFLPNYPSDSTQISYEATGQWGLLRLWSVTEFAPPKRVGDNWPQIGHFLRNSFVTHYRAKCAETNIETSGRCLNGVEWQKNLMAQKA